MRLLYVPSTWCWIGLQHLLTSSHLFPSPFPLTPPPCSLLYYFVLAILMLHRSLHCFWQNYVFQLLIKGAQRLSLNNIHNTSHSFNLSFVDTYLAQGALVASLVSMRSWRLQEQSYEAARARTGCVAPRRPRVQPPLAMR